MRHIRNFVLVIVALVSTSVGAYAIDFFPTELVLTKSFSGPVKPGETVTLTFTITNNNPSRFYGDIDFTDDLDAVLSGLEAVGLPESNICGFGSAVSGTSTISFVSGEVLANSSCSFDVTVQVPSDAAAGDYANTTSSLSGFRSDESSFTFAPAFDMLTVEETAPEINVTGNSVDIADGDASPRSADHTNFGSTDVSGGTISRTFTIENTGDETLTLGANAVSLSGANASNFTVTSQPGSTVAPSGSTTVTIAFDPSASGTRTATVSIANDDADESPYTFAISGEGASSASGITIIQTITGKNRSVRFTSGTSELNFTLTTVQGTAETTVSGLGAGTYTVRSQDLTSEGYALVAAICNDTDSSTDVDERRATIVLAAGEQVTCIFELVETGTISEETIKTYLESRNAMLLHYLPDISRRLHRLLGLPDEGSAVLSVFDFGGAFPLPVDVQISNNVFNYAASSRGVLDMQGEGNSEVGTWDVWSEGHVSWFDDGGSGSGVSGVAYAGVDYLLTENILLGLQVEVDWMDEYLSATSGTVTGTGWMVGPYGLIQIEDNFFFDFGAMWGQSSNQISPFGTYTDTFTTTRWLLYGDLVGEFEIDDNWTIRPQVTGKLISEYQHAYTDSLNVAIPAQTVTQGEIAFAPRISYTGLLEDGTRVIPWVEVRAAYTFTGTGLFSTPGLAPGWTGVNGGIELGVDVAMPGGAFLVISGQYDGFFTGARALGMSAGISAPMQ